jgi:quinol monooxygenase YgiN
VKRSGSFVQTFVIFDVFEEEAGCDEHLNGAVAAALIAHAEELLAVTPAIRKANVLADKLP